MKRDSSGGGYFALEGTVKDGNLFKTFNKQIIEKGTESEKDGVHFITYSEVAVGWDKEKFFYVFNVPNMNFTGYTNTDNSSVVKTDLVSTCKNAFTLTEENSLAKNEKFSELVNKAGDFRFWINSEEFYKGNNGNPALAMLNLDKLYKGSFTTAVASFDAGKINIDSKTYGSEEMTKLYKKYSNGKINEDMLKRIPGKTINAVIALNFKPEALQDFLKLTNLDGLLSMGLTYLGFTMDDFVKANKGDILLSLSDFNFKKENETLGSTTFPSDKPEFNAIFSASIGDKDAFNKLINAGKKLGEKQMMDSTNVPVSYKSNGTYFVMSNTKENVEKYLGSNSNNFDFINKINGQSMGGYFNIQSILKAVESKLSTDSTEKAMFATNLQFWDEVIFKGGDYTDGGVTSHIEINLMDKSTNSLKQLNQYAGKLSQLYIDLSNKRKAELSEFDAVADSVVAVSPSK